MREGGECGVCFVSAASRTGFCCFLSRAFSRFLALSRAFSRLSVSLVSSAFTLACSAMSSSCSAFAASSTAIFSLFSSNLSSL